MSPSVQTDRQTDRQNTRRRRFVVPSSFRRARRVCASREGERDGDETETETRRGRCVVARGRETDGRRVSARPVRDVERARGGAIGATGVR